MKPVKKQLLTLCLAAGLLMAPSGAALADNLAQKICAGLGASTGEKSVTKAANYYVLRLNNHPSVLVETAFLSNPHDEALLATDAYRQKLAEGIYAGVVDYFNQF